MPRHQVWARRPDLDGASAPEEVEDDHDHGDEQKNVDCGRRDVEREEAKQPHDHEDHGEDRKHISALSKWAAGLRPRPECPSHGEGSMSRPDPFLRGLRLAMGRASEEGIKLPISSARGSSATYAPSGRNRSGLACRLLPSPGLARVGASLRQLVALVGQPE